jgi:hypothetical protein
MPELGDILKSINQTKDHDLLDEYNQGDYVPFVINRTMSFHVDTILAANELNQRPGLDKRIQYKYYLNAVRKKYRYSPWLKYKLPSNVQLIKDYYGYSTKRAKEVLPLFSKDDLAHIKAELDKGGIKK